jgi:phosphonate transport system substrate-binding protein
LVAVPVLPVVAADPGRTPERTAVHFAFSREMFREVNENDARAAMKVYARTIGEENGLDTTSEPICLEGTNAIAEALRLKQFDMISLTTEEYFTLEAQGLDGPLLVAKVHQTVTEEYVLLARTDSAIRKVEDLPGHTLMLASDLRASLAPIWLEVLCREHGLGPSHKVFATVETAAKVSQVVLPVFFGKADACVVTRNGWEVMGELNPQVKQQLSVLAVSPPVVPGMSCFRRDLAEPIKQRLLQAAAESWDHPSFKQLMALFKTDELSRQPVAVLADTRRLVEAYHQLGAGTTEK